MKKRHICREQGIFNKHLGNRLGLCAEQKLYVNHRKPLANHCKPSQTMVGFVDTLGSGLQPPII